MEKKLELVLLPISAAGHLISLVEMGIRLLRHDPRFSVTVLLMSPIPFLSPGSATDSYVKSVASSGLDIRFEDLPPVEPPEWDQKDGPGALIALFIKSYQPLVKDSLTRHLSSGAVAALVIDFFATTMIDVADELGVPTYLYFTSTAAMLACLLHLPVIQKKFPSGFTEDDVVEVPGVLCPVPFASFPTFLKDWTTGSFTWMVYHGRMFLKTRGIILNTFTELEPAALEALSEGRCVPDSPTPPLYALGPILGLQDRRKNGKERHQCIKWLDEQPTASVVFLCFGSMGSFDDAQVKEIATGLERSKHRFLWSVRSRPKDQSPLPVPTDATLDEVLPEGFIESTKDRGLVWPSSVPQVEILSHPSVGGFVTHCGWNSVLESFWFGVPMLTWPLYAEQHFNAYRLVRESGIAVELRVDTRNGGFVSADEVENGVRGLMGDSEEGRRVRKRTQEMKDASRITLGEGGSSFIALERLVQELAEVPW